MKCNIDNIVKRDPKVLEGPHGDFFKNPTFECSESFITSLPFDEVKKLRVGKFV